MNAICLPAYCLSDGLVKNTMPRQDTSEMPSKNLLSRLRSPNRILAMTFFNMKNINIGGSSCLDASTDPCLILGSTLGDQVLVDSSHVWSGRRLEVQSDLSTSNSETGIKN